MISSATVIINGPTSHSAVHLALQLGIPLGISINLTDGTPLQHVDNK